MQPAGTSRGPGPYALGPRPVHSSGTRSEPSSIPGCSSNQSRQGRLPIKTQFSPSCHNSAVRLGAVFMTFAQLHWTGRGGGGGHLGHAQATKAHARRAHKLCLVCSLTSRPLPLPTDGICQSGTLCAGFPQSGHQAGQGQLIRRVLSRSSVEPGTHHLQVSETEILGPLTSWNKEGSENWQGVRFSSNVGYPRHGTAASPKRDP